MLQLRLSLLTKGSTEDLAGGVLGYRVNEDDPASDPLCSGDLPVHESHDLLTGGRMTRFQDHICTRSFIVVPIEY